MANTASCEFHSVMLLVGVKVAVRVRPVPLMALMVPPVKDKSPVVPSQLNEVPGSSENVNVNKLVRAVDNTLLLMLMLTVGANVSIMITGDGLMNRLGL